MSNKSDNAAVALQSDKGEQTPLMINPFAVNASQAEVYLKHIEAATKAKKEDFTDITPVYWEAKRGEVQTMVFLGWKRTVKVDEKTGEELSEKFFAVFHDGKRQIVAGQLALLEAMFGRPQNVVYKITCEESVAGKAKKFLVEQFNG